MRSLTLLLLVILTFSSMESSVLWTKVRAPRPQIDLEAFRHQLKAGANSGLIKKEIADPMAEEEALRAQFMKSPLSLFWRFSRKMDDY